ncbi:MAG: hypothetical protein RL020_503 [Pseudomonadota bacterium]|jgi:hypothetical protein
MNISRKEVLENLIEFRRPLKEIGDMLAEHPWDSEVKLVILTPDHVINVLDRFIGGELTTSEIDQWANMIKFRDDIGFRGALSNQTKQAIWELANPDLTHPFSKERADKIRGALLFV